ncbi:MAG: hypothetical protein OXC60_20470 [Litoreibacter sp.]|nr:hypothetical protein [Litoreibacter sp.]
MGVGRATAMAGLILLSACDTAPRSEDEAKAPGYLGIETRKLDDELVSFLVRMTGGSGAEDLSAYTDCAAAQYALIRSYGFARHVRTNVDERAGLWTADAVYTISEARPDGLKTLDAALVVEDCAARGIPTV